MSKNIKRPHKAIINIDFEVHPLKDNGECAGVTVKKEIFEQRNIRPFTLCIDGKNLEDCLDKLKQFLKEINYE